MGQPAPATTATGTLQFIAEFRNIHDKVRGGTLPATDHSYAVLRDRFVRMMAISQIGTSGQTLRSELRMSKMLKVELRIDDAPPERLTTIDIASKGFATLVPTALPIGSVCGFTLFLPKPASPIAGRVRVASVRSQGSVMKTSFLFDGLMASAAEQLDIALVDAVLERLATKF